MRVDRNLVALLSSGIIIRTASAALTAVTGLTASANAWDERTDDSGCVPDSCLAGLAIDGSIDEQSRWSCNAGVSMVDACELTLTLEEPQNLVEMRMSLWKGDQRIRSLNIFVDGTLVTTISSSGMTEGFETYELTALQASTVMVQANEPLPDSGWLSIIELELMVESAAILEETTAGPPTDDTYVGCFTDTLDDRTMSIVTTLDDLTLEVCAATCAESGSRFYAVQQGNECWCSGCDLTDYDTNTDYDRHGEGECTAVCAGDSSMVCGGDMAFNLYQTGSCVVTPAPTFAPLEVPENVVTPAPTSAPLEVPENGCPDDSIPSSLEISLVWTEDVDLDLHVYEPGGEHVYNSNRLGDVGTISDDDTDGPGSETYILLNGLNIDEDEVLGTYRAWVQNGPPGTPWILTARLAGELEWAISGVIPANYSHGANETLYPVNVTEYTESTCSIDIYGTCPGGTFSDDGTAPCTVCPNGKYSSYNSTTCSTTALLSVDASDELLTTMDADATGGFAGPGTVELDGNDSYVWQRIYLYEEGAGVLEVTGTFQREVDGDASLPSSTALFVYLELDDESFMRGEGTIDPPTGKFTATVMDVPDGSSKVFYSFVVLDPEEAVVIDDGYADSVFDSEVVSISCPSPLTITLEWNTDNSDLDMEITEPDGLSWYAWDIGTYGFGSGDVNDGFGPEIWTVFPGNPGAVGTYTVRVHYLSTPGDTEWTLTARVNGEIVWIETDIIGQIDSGFAYGYYSDDSFQSELFSVTLDSVDTEEC